MTRVEIGEGVRAVIDDGGATRDELIAAARSHGARDEIVAVLEGLRRPSYTELRQLWVELPSLPVKLD